LKWKDKPKMVG